MTIKNLKQPENPHPLGKGPFFEGWYFKLHSADSQHSLVLIPGYFKHKDGKLEIFLHIYAPLTNNYFYLAFPQDQIKMNPDEFFIKLDNCRFSDKGIELNIQKEEIKLQCSLDFSEQKYWPKKGLSTSIMGPFLYLPFMECFYAVPMPYFKIRGKVQFQGMDWNFNQGTGYCEKNWGSSFPSDWIWLQSNFFQKKRQTSFLFSMAEIPLGPFHFQGIAAYLYFDDQFFCFTSYQGAKLVHWQFEDNKLMLEIRQGRYYLNLQAAPGDFTALKAPSRQGMNSEIKESLNSKIVLSLSEKKGGRREFLFEDSAINCGMEFSPGYRVKLSAPL